MVRQKCNAFKTGSETDFVWGVVFDIDEKEKPTLDKVEGVGGGYDDHEVLVTTAAGEELRVRTYLADPNAIDATLAPFDWYKAYVLDGAIEHRLPPDYIRRFIRAVLVVKTTRGNR
jgi:gamma-glutamylcyclotransferase